MTVIYKFGKRSLKSGQNEVPEVHPRMFLHHDQEKDVQPVGPAYILKTKFTQGKSSPPPANCASV